MDRKVVGKKKPQGLERWNIWDISGSKNSFVKYFWREVFREPQWYKQKDDVKRWTREMLTRYLLETKYAEHIVHDGQSFFLWCLCSSSALIFICLAVHVRKRVVPLTVIVSRVHRMCPSFPSLLFSGTGFGLFGLYRECRFTRCVLESGDLLTCATWDMSSHQFVYRDGTRTVVHSSLIPIHFPKHTTPLATDYSRLAHVFLLYSSDFQGPTRPVFSRKKKEKEDKDRCWDICEVSFFPLQPFPASSLDPHYWR